MARTILYTVGFLFTVLCMLVSMTAVSAASLPVITVTQGESVTVSVDLTYGADANANELTVSVPGINYYRNTALSNAVNPTLTDAFPVTAAPGSYAMSVRVGRDGQTLRFTQYTLTVLPAGNKPAAPTAAIITTTAPAPRPSGIQINPIPDMVAGESFILPVTISGNGEYTIEIPNLNFARYELPNPVVVHNTLTVPVLIELKSNLAPGTYAIPITVGSETATARIRVIEYRDANTAWLIIIGVALVFIALILLMQRKPYTRTPPRPPTPPENNDAEKLITYY